MREAPKLQTSSDVVDDAGDGEPDRTIRFTGDHPATREEDRNADGRTDLLCGAGTVSIAAVEEKLTKLFCRKVPWIGVHARQQVGNYGTVVLQGGGT